MHHFKNYQKNLSPEGLRENVWGEGHENVSPGTTVAVDEPRADFVNCDVKWKKARTEIKAAECRNSRRHFTLRSNFQIHVDSM